MGRKRKEPRWRYIYQLSDPDTGLVHYIGNCTTLRTTIRRHKDGNNNPPRVRAWLLSLRAQGKRARIKFLQQVPEYSAYQVEGNYIRSYFAAFPGQLMNVRAQYSVREGMEREARLRRARYVEERRLLAAARAAGL